MKRLILGLLFCSNIVIASSSLYVPQVELDLQIGKSRNYGRASVLVPFAKDGNSLPFLNVFGLSDSLGASEGNIGLGYRRLYSDAIYGGYVFYDKRKSKLDNMYQQLTFGAEYLLQNFEARVNGYAPIGKSKNITANSHMERSLPGFDIELGGNLFSNLEGYVSFYYFGDKDVSMPGYRLRSVYSINSNVKLLGEISHDKIRGFNYFAGIKLRASLGSEKGLSGLEKKMVQNVVRDIDIVVDEEQKPPNFIFKDNVNSQNGINSLDDIALSQLHDEIEKNYSGYFSVSNIKRAYRKLALKCHPDRPGGSSDAFKSLVRAQDGLLRKHDAATRIQSVYRGKVSRCQDEDSLLSHDRYRAVHNIKALQIGSNPESVCSYQLLIRDDNDNSYVVATKRNHGYFTKPLNMNEAQLEMLSERRSNEDIDGIIIKGIGRTYELSFRGNGGMPGAAEDDGSGPFSGGAVEETMSSEGAAWHGDAFRKKLRWAVDNCSSGEVVLADFFAEWVKRIKDNLPIDNTVDFLNIKNKHDSNVLHFAACYGRVPVLQWIYDTYPSVEDRQALVAQAGATGMTISHFAAFHGHVPILQWIYDNYSSVADRRALLTQAGGNGVTIAHLAAMSGNAHVLQWIYDAYSSAADRQSLLTHADGNGSTVSHLAAMNGRVPVLQWIYDTCPSVEDRQALVAQAGVNGFAISHLAAMNGNVPVLQWIYDTYSSVADRQALVTQASGKGNTISHLAAQRGEISVLQWIYDTYSSVADRQALVTQAGSNGGTISHEAAMNGNVPVLQWIYDTYSSVADRQFLLTQANGNGNAISHLAAQRGEISVLQWIYDTYSSVEDRQVLVSQAGANGITIYHLAAMDGHVPVLQWIYDNYSSVADRQALVTQADNDGDTMAHWAAMKGHVPVLQWIYDNYSSVADRQALVTQAGGNGGTISHEAAMNGHVPVLQWVYDTYSSVADRQALVTQAGGNGGTISHEAAMNGHVPVLQWVYDTYSSVADRQALVTQAGGDGMKIYHPAACYGRVPVLQWIYDTYPSVEDRQALVAQAGATGSAISHLAAMNGNVPVLQWIYDTYSSVADRQALLTQADGKGKTIYHWAAMNGHVPVLQWIYDTYPSDANRQSLLTQANGNGNAISHLAAIYGRVPVLQWIYDAYSSVADRQALVTQASDSGYTVSHWAAINGNVLVLQWIFQRCSFANGGVSQGLSAAAEQEPTGVVSLGTVLSAVPHAGVLAGKPTVQIIAEKMPQEFCIELMSISPSKEMKELFVNSIMRNQARLFPNVMNVHDVARISNQPCLYELAGSQDGRVVLNAQLNEAIASLENVRCESFSGASEDAAEVYNSGVMSGLKNGLVIAKLVDYAEQWTAKFSLLPDWVKEYRTAKEVLDKFNFEMANAYAGPLAIMFTAHLSHLENIVSGVHFSDAQFMLYNAYMSIMQSAMSENREAEIKGYCDKAAKALIKSGALERILKTSSLMNGDILFAPLESEGNPCAIKIQSLYRGFCVRSDFSERRDRLIFIKSQSLIHKRAEEIVFSKATQVQSLARCKSEVKKLAAIKKGITQLQALVRGRVEAVKLAGKNSSIKRI